MTTKRLLDQASDAANHLFGLIVDVQNNEDLDDVGLASLLADIDEIREEIFGLIEALEETEG